MITIFFKKEFLYDIKIFHINYIFFLSCTVIFNNKKENVAIKNNSTIIPEPLEYHQKDGCFKFDSNITFKYDKNNEDIKRVVEKFISQFEKVSGFHFSDSRDNKIINISLVDGNIYGDEGYSIDIDSNKIDISANKWPGIFYAFITLEQMLPAEFFSKEVQKDIDWNVPQVRIFDKPRFKWRGFMLDVSRHFFSVSTIKNFLDYLSLHKINKFHWHLIDDQGWRIEIKKYPKLTEVGAWRVDREDKHWRNREPQKPGEKATYGGYYTQEEIREVIKYAGERNIEVIPEIEMPGHCTSAIASYPWLTCRSDRVYTVPPGSIWPIKDVYCPGKETTFEFLEDVLKEVIELFPSKYIHIGGDEVDKTEWEKCPYCQKRMKEEGLKDVSELQSYFIKRIEKFLNKNGRILIGWDEILEGGLAPNAVVMSWRGVKGGIIAAKEKHYVVMSPTSHCYFDYYQGDPDKEPLAIGGYTTLKKVYSYEPIPKELNEEEAKYVMGAQANLWTEYVPNQKHAEYMTFPRIAALSEVLWSNKESKNWEDFKRRILRMMKIYDLLDINYAKSIFAVDIRSFFDKEQQKILVKMETQSFNPEIYFTLDGSDPDNSSIRYKKPVEIKKTCLIKAVSYLNGKKVSGVSNVEFFYHKALGKKINLKFPYSEKYFANGDFSLVDGFKGSMLYSDSLWQGFWGTDLVATIDLEKISPIKYISINFLQSVGSWIFLPKKIEFFISSNGNDYKRVAVFDNVEVRENFIIKTFEKQLDSEKARFVRIFAKNIEKCPQWHPGAGDKAWLFADEIIVN